MSIGATVVADSVSPEGVRLTTLEVTLHRFVLAELNTHRVFSRNSASSRAIPVAKQIERLIENPALPVVFPAEQRGMQGGDALEGAAEAEAQLAWMTAGQEAVNAALRLVELGVHKSVVNRLLEPFMWHTVIITATAWENFFALRLDADAQPEIRHAAIAMRSAYDNSDPTPIREGGWHLPYIRSGELLDFESGDLTRISAARCARVSYLTHDGVCSPQADLTLYRRLVIDRVAAGLPVHWSPLEHVATPNQANRQSVPLVTPTLKPEAFETIPVGHLPRVGNLLGWASMRSIAEAELGARTFS